MRHQGGHGVADVLLRGIGKVVHPGGGGEGRHGVDAHRVHDGLHGDLAQLDGGLLHGAGPAILTVLRSSEPSKTSQRRPS